MPDIKQGDIVSYEQAMESFPNKHVIFSNWQENGEVTAKGVLEGVCDTDKECDAILDQLFSSGKSGIINFYTSNRSVLWQV